MGVASLSNAELIAIFLRTGLRGKGVVQVARELLEKRGGTLESVARTSILELTKQAGIGPAKAAQLAAAFELGRRLVREEMKQISLESPDQIFDLLSQEMRALPQESVRIVLLDNRRILIKVEEITRGTLNECLLHPREVLRCVLAHSCHSYILVHNHPSGNPSPSPADREITRRLQRASDTVGVSLTDHIIIGAAAPGSDPYFSFREAGLL
jgi:DNA repair protein RadC